MEEKLTMYVLSGGPQDLSDLYLPSMDEVAGFIKTDLEACDGKDTEELEWTVGIKLMTQKEIDDLPEYQF